MLAKALAYLETRLNSDSMKTVQTFVNHVKANPELYKQPEATLAEVLVVSSLKAPFRNFGGLRYHVLRFLDDGLAFNEQDVVEVARYNEHAHA